ncbi:hypothetical protein D3C78_1887140 [compost metagenome]
MLPTSTVRFFASLLIRLDLPTLGWPTTITRLARGKRPRAIILAFTLSCSTCMAFWSPGMPWPVWALMATTMWPWLR